MKNILSTVSNLVHHHAHHGQHGANSNQSNNQSELGQDDNGDGTPVAEPAEEALNALEKDINHLDIAGTKPNEDQSHEEKIKEDLGKKGQKAADYEEMQWECELDTETEKYDGASGHKKSYEMKKVHLFMKMKSNVKDAEDGNSVSSRETEDGPSVKHKRHHFFSDLHFFSHHKYHKGEESESHGHGSESRKAFLEEERRKHRSMDDSAFFGHPQQGGKEEGMASCFEFRQRSNTFDLHQIGRHETHSKMSLLGKLLHRSKSESHVKKSPTSSPSISPKASPQGQPRRRFCRVIRDGQSVGEEYVNPHVIRKYNRGYWESKHLVKSQSLDEEYDPNRPLPYTVSGHTILKKHHSLENSPEGSPKERHKSCSFKDDVEILEYDIKGKCLLIHSDSLVTHERLHDDIFCDSVEDPDSDSEVIHAEMFLECKNVTLEVINENAELLVKKDNDDDTSSESSLETDTTNTDSELDKENVQPLDSDSKQVSLEQAKVAECTLEKQDSLEDSSAPKKSKMGEPETDSA